MNRAILMIVVAVLSFSNLRGDAATFSSTKTINQQLSYGWYLSTTASHETASFAQYSFFTLGDRHSGVNSAKVTVDTGASTGMLDDIQLKPFRLTPYSTTQTFSVNFLVIDVPAMFPNPPVTHRVQGQYRQTMTVSSMTTITPTFVSSSTNAIRPNLNYPQFFMMYNTVMLSSPSFVVNGAYEVTGPHSSVTTPFSVEFRPVFAASTVRTRIVGDSDFGNGFDFYLDGLAIPYQPVAPLIYEGTVDELDFHASFSNISAQFAVDIFPEPASGQFGAMAALTLTAMRRRTGKFAVSAVARG